MILAIYYLYKIKALLNIEGELQLSELGTPYRSHRPLMVQMAGTWPASHCESAAQGGWSPGALALPRGPFPSQHAALRRGCRVRWCALAKALRIHRPACPQQIVSVPPKQKHKRWLGVHTGLLDSFPSPGKISANDLESKKGDCSLRGNHSEIAEK